MNFILINQINIVTEKLTAIYKILSFVHIWKNDNYTNQEVGTMLYGQGETDLITKC